MCLFDGKRRLRSLFFFSEIKSEKEKKIKFVIRRRKNKKKKKKKKKVWGLKEIFVIKYIKLLEILTFLLGFGNLVQWVP